MSDTKAIRIASVKHGVAIQVASALGEREDDGRRFE
jgi:hypothetical protein